MSTPMTVFCLVLLLAGVAPAADSLNIRLVGRWDSLPDNYSFGVAAQGNHACVADFAAGLRVISVADPMHPTEVGYYDPPGHAAGVAVVGNLAYVSDGEAGLRVISLADPAHPTEIGSCATPGYAREGVVVGDLVYVAHDSGLSVISVADPAHPSEVGRYENQYGAFGVAVAGDNAYIGNNEGLWIISVSDPTQPTWVGRYITSAMGVAVRDSYAYVAAASAGLRVVSVTDPANPVEIGHLAYSTAHVRLAVSGDYVYLVPGLNARGLRVISVADPANPVEVGYHYLGRNCVALDGGNVYAGDGFSLVILQFYGEGVEESFKPQAAGVKPGLRVVRGVLRLDKDASASSSWLRDETGRKVQALHQGANDVSRLAPGVYFVHKAQAQAQTQTVTKVIVVR